MLLKARASASAKLQSLRQVIESEIELRRHSGPCIGCDQRPAHASAAGSLLLRFAGYCGEMRGAASLQLLQADSQPLLVLRDVALAAATDAACY